MIPFEAPKTFLTLANLITDHGGDLNEAHTYAIQAVQRNPNWHVAYNTRGNILLKLGRPLEAKRVLEEALRLNSEDSFAHSNLGEAYKELGDTSQAEYYYRKALDLDGDNKLTQFRLGALIVNSGSGTVERFLEVERL